MSEEGFLRRWARRKTEVREDRELPPEPGPAHAPVPASPPPDAAVLDPAARSSTAPAAPSATPAPSNPVAEAPQPAAAAGAALTPASTRPLPTMEDVAALDMDADFSAFVARGVEQAVRRSALKKLFADPHFKVMDRLDVYIDDFTKPSPVSEEMLASLTHARSVFRKMLEDEPQPVQEPAPEQAQPEQAQPEQAQPELAQPEQAQPEPQQPPEQETQ